MDLSNLLIYRLCRWLTGFLKHELIPWYLLSSKTSRKHDPATGHNSKPRDKQGEHEMLGRRWFQGGQRLDHDDIWRWHSKKVKRHYLIGIVIIVMESCCCCCCCCSWSWSSPSSSWTSSSSSPRHVSHESRHRPTGATSSSAWAAQRVQTGRCAVRLRKSVNKWSKWSN